MAEEKQDRNGGGGSGPSAGEGSTVIASEDAYRSHVGLERVAELDAEGELEPGVGVGEPGASLGAGAPAGEAAAHPTPVPPAPLGKSARALGSALHAHTRRAERRASSSAAPGEARSTPSTEPTAQPIPGQSAEGAEPAAPGGAKRGRAPRKRPPA